MLGIALQTTQRNPWAGGGVAAMNALMECGFIVAPGGALGDVISLTPPLVITEEQLSAGVDAIASWIRGLDT